jgi:hypothetical protein
LYLVVCLTFFTLLQEHLPPILSKLSATLAGGSSSNVDSTSSSSSSGEQLFTREELALYVGGKPPNKEQIYIAILGQVFDVSKAPQFYSEWQGPNYLMYFRMRSSCHCCPGQQD